MAAAASAAPFAIQSVLSSISKVAVFKVVVVPFTVRLPATVRLLQIPTLHVVQLISKCTLLLAPLKFKPLVPP